jgi:pilus assembly protein CpaB
MGRTILIAAVVLLLLFVVLISVFGGGGSDEEEVPPTTNVVMVLQPIDRGEVINSERLRMVAYPTQDLIPDLMFQSVEEVVGKYAFYDLKQGVIITKNMVVENAYLIPALESSVSLMIPKEWVAVSIPINRFSSVSYGVQRGDHVNLIVSMLVVDLDVDFQTRTPNQTTDILSPGPPEFRNYLAVDVFGDPPTYTQLGKAYLDENLNQPFYVIPSETNQRPRLVTQTLVQNVVILHVGDFIEPPPEPTTEEESHTHLETDSLYPRNVTIIVSPQDAVTLNYLMLTGAQLSMALRPPNDDSQFISEAVTLDYLFSRYAIPLPSRLPYGLEPRVDGLILPRPTSPNTGNQ